MTENTKKASALAAYKASWELEFKWITSSTNGKHWAYCKMCYAHFSVTGCGKFQATRHFKCKSHQDCFGTMCKPFYWLTFCWSLQIRRPERTFLCALEKNEMGSLCKWEWTAGRALR